MFFRGPTTLTSGVITAQRQRADPANRRTLHAAQALRGCSEPEALAAATREKPDRGGAPTARPPGPSLASGRARVRRGPGTFLVARVAQGHWATERFAGLAHSPSLTMIGRT